MPQKRDLIGKTVLTYWQVVDFIGSGGYGNVYRAQRSIGNDIIQAAIKHIILPEQEQYDARLVSNRNNVERTDKYFKKLYDDILTEIRAMDRLSGKSANIVAYRNHEVIEHHDPKRYEIFIEMELLTPYDKYCISRNQTVGEVLKMGTDIASALEICHAKDIMHRDIKEANIFVDGDGNFKLGDFGLAKILTEGSKAKSDAGTMHYKAPEVLIPFAEYRKTVDIYSLGIVLYKLFNYGKIPFLPPYPDDYDYEDETKALGRRLRGDELPRPQCATKEMADVVLKACAPKPENRYQTATELKLALQMLAMSLTELERNIPLDIAPSEFARMQETQSKGYSGIGESINEEYRHGDLFESGESVSNKPSVKQEANVEADIDKKLWEIAGKIGTLAAFREYIENNVAGKRYEADALQEISRLEREAAVREKPEEVAGQQPQVEIKPRGRKNLVLLVAGLLLMIVVIFVVGATVAERNALASAQASASASESLKAQEAADKAAADKAAAEKTAADKTAADKTAADKAAADKAAADKAAADKAVASEDITVDTFDNYVVKSGDTLNRILILHYGDSILLDAFMQYNGIIDANGLWIGMSLKIPTRDILLSLQLSKTAAPKQLNRGEYLLFGQYYNEPILWKCVDMDAEGITLVSEYILCLKAYDAAESGINGQGSNDVQKYGSNIWSNSNIREWLNSSAQTVSYSTQAPTKSAIWYGYDAYADEPGFLTNFTQAERDVLKAVNREGVSDKVFLLSVDEVNKYIGNTDSKRMKKITSTGWSKSDYYTGADVTHEHFLYLTSSPYSGSSCYLLYVNKVGTLNSGCLAGGGNGYSGVAPSLHISSYIPINGSGTISDPWKK